MTSGHMSSPLWNTSLKNPFPICQRSKVICRANGFQDKLQSEETLEVGKLKRCTSHIALSNGINHKILMFNSQKNVSFFSGVMIGEVECPYLLALNFTVFKGLCLCEFFWIIHIIYTGSHIIQVYKGLSQKWLLHPQSTFSLDFAESSYACHWYTYKYIKAVFLCSMIALQFCQFWSLAGVPLSQGIKYILISLKVGSARPSRSMVNWCVNSTHLSNQKFHVLHIYLPLAMWRIRKANLVGKYSRVPMGTRVSTVWHPVSGSFPIPPAMNHVGRSLWGRKPLHEGNNHMSLTIPFKDSGKNWCSSIFIFWLPNAWV